MTIIKVYASRAYDVIVGKELLDKSGELCKAVISHCKACIVTDDTVAEL